MNSTGKPLMCGYLRGLPRMEMRTAFHLMREMAPFAESAGFSFGTVFFEDDWLRSAAWDSLIRTCRRTGARDVVLPDLEHLHTVPELRGVTRTVFENAIGGRLWVLARPGYRRPGLGLRS